MIFNVLVNSPFWRLLTLPVRTGNLIAIDGSLIDGVLSMDWAQYRKGSKKAKAHVGFSINNGAPYKAFLTDGNSAERPFVNQILEKGQTSVTDRGYLLLAIYCHQEHGEKVSINRVRELRYQIINESRETELTETKAKKKRTHSAKT